MKPAKINHQPVQAFFQSSEDIVIASHQRPDGDAVGAVLGLGLSLMSLGKVVQMVLVDGVPEKLRFLHGSDLIQRSYRAARNQVIIALDCSDQARLGKIFDGKIIDLNIDHHVTNLGFAGINVVEPDASATCEILAQSMPRWGLPLPKSGSEALLAGILIDTIGFKTPNVSHSTLRLSADLVELGADLNVLYSKSLDARSYQALRYWGHGLKNLVVEDNLAWSTLSLEDRKAAGYAGNDDADLINLLSSIEETNITVLFTEQKNSVVKVSWRAKPDWDVSAIALDYGGGGHKAAAGAEISGDFQTVIAQVLAATKKLIA